LLHIVETEYWENVLKDRKLSKMKMRLLKLEAHRVNLTADYTMGKDEYYRDGRGQE
jgi:hypothetical protein